MTEPTNDDHLEDRLRGYLERFTSYQPRGQSALDTALPGVPHRRRLGLIAAVAVVALCVTGTATAALVVTLHRSGVNDAALGSSTTSLGRSFFIPIAGPQGGNTAPGTAASPQNGFSSGAALKGPLPPGAFASSSAAGVFPGNYSCAGGGSAQVANGQIQVQGIATVGAADQTTIEQLTIQVSGSGATNKAAVTDAQAREVAVNTAMQTVGIRSADITLGPVQIGQNGYFSYNPGQPSKPSASAIITVNSSDPVQLGTAADAAQQAGGSQVSSYSAYGTEFSTPSGSDLATALGDATTSAHDEAVAAATAAGLHLGKVSGLTSSPPSLCYGASGERLVVTVIINYGISP